LIFVPDWESVVCVYNLLQQKKKEEGKEEDQHDLVQRSLAIVVLT
jgi:hypothetical protein